ncbi:MAG: hypothetical protein OEM02_06290 [Desulfobulbaceae bacterium]|nr:hypothetical protein [Desulfobulbaceae bacterium]
MNRYLSLLFLVLWCCVGCSARSPFIGEPVAQRPEAADLWGLRIVHRDSPKFSGIMGLEAREQGVYCVVLDATGVPLLEGVVMSPDTIEVTRCIEELRKRRFPELISRVVGGLYFTPLNSHCSWYDWGCAVRFDLENGPGEMVEYRFGPFTGWRATGNPGFENAVEMMVSFPWQGLDVYMKKM